MSPFACFGLNFEVWGLSLGPFLIPGDSILALFGALEAPGGVSADHVGLESQKGPKKSET